MLGAGPARLLAVRGRLGLGHLPSKPIFVQFAVASEPFPRVFFATRMSPPRLQQHSHDKPASEEQEPSNRTLKQQLKHENPTALPGAGAGMFGFGAGAGVDAILTALIGITVVFIGGVAYIEAAFEPGYDPALELANQPGRRGEVDEDGRRDYPQSARHMKRKEQEIMDSIMEGKEAGYYYLFVGPKVLEKLQ
ncbi:hypothetical protein FRC12_015318 [Ceratobasidium sp. 428]|nr:hypothetical protein FRC12_015318 [Ceratobasidium sp. 428]